MTQVVTETQIVEVPVEVYRPVPEQLTARIKYPPTFQEDITVGALIDRLFVLYDLLDRANRDRAFTKKLTSEE